MRYVLKAIFALQVNKPLDHLILFVHLDTDALRGVPIHCSVNLVNIKMQWEVLRARVVLKAISVMDFCTMDLIVLWVCHNQCLVLPEATALRGLCLQPSFFVLRAHSVLIYT